MRVLIITENLGAVAQIRLISPLELLQKKGALTFDVVTLSANQKFDLRRLEKFTVVIFQRMDKPETLQILEYARKAGCFCIYELDDDLFRIPAEHPLHDYFHSDKRLDRIREHIRNVTLVTVSTEALAASLAAVHDNVTVIRNTIDPAIFSFLAKPPIADDLLRIGYAGGWTHADDFRQVLPALQRLLDERRDRIRLIFFWYQPDELKDHPSVEYLGGVDDLRAYAQKLQAARLDIGLAPLAGNPFSAAKSDEKYLEYSARKIAGLYSAFGPYLESIKDGQNGLLVQGESPDQWYRQLVRLIDDPDLRASISAAAFEDISQNRTVSAAADRWAEILADIPARKPGKMSHTSLSVEPLVSIIIPVRNRLELTRQCLRAIADTAKGIPHEIIVVDNNSDDGTGNFLQALGEPVRVIHNAAPRNFSESNNQAAKVARSKHLIFLNNDTLPQPGWLQAFLDAAERYPQAGSLGAKLIYPENDTIQHAGVLVKNYPISVAPYHVHRFFQADSPLVNQERAYPCVTAACMLIQRDLFLDMGGFDEEYIFGFEDVDLCFRLLERGLKNYYIPAVEVYHYESQSAGRNDHENHNVRRMLTTWSPKIEGLLQPFEEHLDHVEVSIILLSYNTLEFTKNCIDLIQRVTQNCWELVVVDNGSTDGSVEYLRRIAGEAPNIRFLENATNAGFAAGNNQGVAAATGKYVILLNNDILVGRLWLERLLAALEMDPQIGLVGPVSNHISGRQLITGIDYNDDLGFLRFADRVRRANLNKITPRRRIAGFAMLLEKSLYEELGGLDEIFGSGNYEDDDFCLRLREKGYAIMVDEGTFIHHYGSATFSANQIDYQASLARNKAVFERKWPAVDQRWLLEQDQPLVDVLAEQVDAAWDAIQAGDVKSGSALTDALLSEDPLSPGGLSCRGLLALTAGNTAVAGSYFRKALWREGSCARADLGLVALKIADQAHATAQLSLVRMLEQDPQNLDARRLLAGSLLDTGQMDAGVQILAGMLQEDPSDWLTHFLLGKLFAEAGQPQQARAHLNRAIEANSAFPYAIELLKNLP